MGNGTSAVMLVAAHVGTRWLLGGGETSKVAVAPSWPSVDPVAASAPRKVPPLVVGVTTAPAGAAATATKAAATSAAAGATAPRLRLLTKPPEYRRIRATPHPRDAYGLGARRLRVPPRHFFRALLLAARVARAR